MSTESEKIIAQINDLIFFKEFTFNQSNFPAENGELEVADSFILLDDIVIVIQAKERDILASDNPKSVRNWFQDKVLKKAKNQIKDSLSYLKRYPWLAIENSRGHKINIPDIAEGLIRKVILYLPNSKNFDEDLRNEKFYVSKDVGCIHVLHIEDYYYLCDFLITPAELNSYLIFRESMNNLHGRTLKNLPEQYLLSHFLYNPDDLTINEKYIELLPRFKNEKDAFDVSYIIEKFYDKIHKAEDKISSQYYPILKEIAKLNRHSLIEFKERFNWMIENIRMGSPTLLPRRFGNPTTDCGFVFFPLGQEDKEHWFNAISNTSALFKYKHRYTKCIGVIGYKFGDYFDLQWCYFNAKWEFDADLDKLVATETEEYGRGETIARFYEFNN